MMGLKSIGGFQVEALPIREDHGLMPEITFTVVIPTYNRADLLPTAIESVLSQSYPALEILVVDDGSTDETRRVLNDFCDAVRYIHQENAGVSAARNRGIREASGDVVAFLDSDDAWAPTKLQAHADVYRRWPDVGWAVSDTMIVDDHLQPHPGQQGFARAFPLFPDLRKEPMEFFGSAMALEQLESSGALHQVFRGDAFSLLLQGNFVQPSALTVRRNVFKRTGAFDESFRVAEETELATRLAASVEGAVIMAPLARWRIGSHESIVKPHNLITLMENALLSLERISASRHLNEREHLAYRKGLESLWLRLAYEHLSNLNRSAARESLHRAFEAGVSRSRRAIALWAATFMPLVLLRSMHRLKRLVQKK